LNNHNSVESQDDEQGMLLGRDMQDYSRPRKGYHKRIDLLENMYPGTNLGLESSALECQLT
jgi:hypothetical protein